MSEKTVRILCLALAEYARVEAMKTANASRVMRDEYPEYSANEFGYCASALDQLAQEVINQ